MTENLGRLYECSVKPALFPIVFLPVGATLRFVYSFLDYDNYMGDYRAPFGALWQGNLGLRGSYKAIK